MLVTLSKKKPLLICSFLVIGLLAVAGCSKPKTSYDYLTQARQAREKGNDRAALIDLKNALKKDPKNGEARLLFAQILNGHGEGSAAEIEVRKAIDLGVNKSFAAATLGKALLLQSQYQKVLDEVALIDGDKGKVAADIYNVRGDAYIGLRKVDEAKSAFENALKEDSNSADAYLGMVQLAALRNDFEEALHQTEMALAKDPNKIEAWLMKASLFRVQNKDEDARAAYKHILQVDKSNVAAHIGLASIDMAQNKLDAAKSEVEAAMKIAPNSLMVNFALGTVELRRGHFKDSQEAVQKVLKAAPDYIPGILLRGAVGFALGSYEQALNDLNRVVARYPSDAYARRLLAATQFKLGETEHALKTLQPLLKPEVEDAQALALAGEVQMKAKNYAKASEYLQKALEINPQVEQIHTQLGLSYLGAGDTQRGLNELEEAAKRSPGQSPADTMLILNYLQRKDYNQALGAISNLEKKVGPNPVTYYLKGVVLLRHGNYSDARKAFEQALTLQPSYFAAAANLARLDVRDNMPDMARKRLEAILEKDKSNVPAMMALADLAESQKQGQEYAQWLERTIEAKPDAVLPRFRLVYYYIAKQDKANALKVATDAVKHYPESAGALSLLGTTQLAVGKNEEALRTFTKLIQVAPNMPTYYVQLAQAQIAVNKPHDARISLNKALKLEPASQQALTLLIRLEVAENKVSDALKIARELEARQPKSPAGYDNEADILVTQKQYAQAVKAYEQALDRGAGPAVLIKIYRALNDAGDGKAAEQRLKSWLKKYPADIVVRTYAAEHYMINNRNRDAIAQYEELLKITSQNATALNNLANLYQRVGDSRAVATAEQALKLSPQDPVIQDTLGWILVQQGDQLPRSIKLLHEAAAGAPKGGTIHYHLAVALARSGQNDEAKKELEAAIGAPQTFPELGDAKAMLKNM